MSDEGEVSGTPVKLPPKNVTPGARIGVTIATPKRHFAGPQDLPPQIGHALRELAQRGTPAWPVREFKTQAERDGQAAWDKEFRRRADRYEFEFMAVVGGMCRARNNAVAEFLASPSRFIIWHDDDLDAMPEDGCGSLADCWLRMLEHRQAVVAAMYCTRGKRPHWATNFMPAAEIQPDADGLLQVAETGIGCKLYHRKVFEQLDAIFGEAPLQKTPKDPSIRYRDRDTGETIAGFFQNVVNDGDLLSEDFFLDYLCRCARVPILVDTKIKLRHVGKAKSFTGAIGDPRPMVENLEVYPEGPFPPIPAVDEAERRERLAIEEAGK